MNSLCVLRDLVAKMGCYQSRDAKKRVSQSCALIIMAIALINPVAAQKTTFSRDDILKVFAANGVAISPQGDWIAYTLSGLDFKHNTTNINVFLASAAAKKPVTRRLTNDAAQNINPQWSPDGNALRRNDKRSKRQVIAALNADFFDLKTGEIENNQIIAGEFVKGVKITGSPHDTFDNIHSQFALSFDGRPFIERFAFAGRLIWRDGSVSELSGVNTVPDKWFWGCNRIAAE